MVFHLLISPHAHDSQGTYFLEMRVSQNLAKLGGGGGGGARQKLSDGLGTDGISGLTGEVELHGHNGPEI